MATPHPSSSASGLPSGLLYGAAYYAEYQPHERTAQDLDLMKEAGFTVIRVGESVWSTWEPREGEFDLEWLAPVLDGAHERGISVILGTPTYAVPPWLQRSYPEIAGETATGVRHPWGARQEVDYSHAAFRFHAERVNRRILERYASHPAVIGFQVDNEPGMLLLHNRATFLRFVEGLKARYGDVETLNREWGLVYWSHRIADWAELWTPEGNTVPQYDLAWRSFQAEVTTEFIAWQAALVREYADPAQFVTTCIAYPRPALDDRRLTEALDVTAANPYYAMQDHLDLRFDLAPLSEWTTSGVAGLFRQADRAYSSKQDRFLVTETNAQSIDGSHNTLPPYPGQLAQAAFALVARGARMVEYWHWHTLHFGTETYWGGVIPHSQVPGRVYREVSAIGAAFAAIGDRLDGYVPDADVAILWSNASKFALEYFPPLSTPEGRPDRASYTAVVDAFHRGVVDAGRQARIVHDTQIAGRSAAELVAAHPVLIAPVLYVADDGLLELLRDYALAGGHLVIGIRTGYGDEEARARLDVAPGPLREVAGVSYEEFSNLAAPLAVEGSLPSPGSHGTRWADGLLPDGAEVLARYDHAEFGRFAAVTSAAAGAGRVTTVGTVPDTGLAADLVRFLAPEPVAGDWRGSGAVTVSSGSTGGGSIAVVHNWSGETGSVTPPVAATDLVSGDRLPAGVPLTLDPRAVLVLAVDGR